MSNGLNITVEPTVEPVLLGEAKDHLLVSHTDDDALIQRIIKQARRYVEKFTKRQLITATYTLTLDDFPRSAERTLYLPVAPLGAVISIGYVDADGDSQTMDSGLYRVDDQSTIARITPEYDKDWPDTRKVMNAVTVTFTAGYGDSGSDVPEDLRGTIFLLLGHYYESRDASVIGAASTPIYLGVDDLLEPYSIRSYV